MSGQSDFRELMRSVAKARETFLIRNYETAVTFVVGATVATGAYGDFQRWFIDRHPQFSASIPWPWHIMKLSLPALSHADITRLSREESETAFQEMMRLLDEFLSGHEHICHVGLRHAESNDGGAEDAPAV
jgi:hypothetical protein